MFPCTSCGLCCQNIQNIDELKSFHLGDGICKHFDVVNKNCLIYENRPNICKIDKMFELVYYKDFTKEEFYIANAHICNNLQKKYKIDSSFKVIIGE